jgi:hypothetical protein
MAVGCPSPRRRGGGPALRVRRLWIWGVLGARRRRSRLLDATEDSLGKVPQRPRLWPGAVSVKSSRSSRSRSGGFNTVNHTLNFLVSRPWRGRLGGGIGDDGGDWWSFPSLQHLPLGRLGFGVGCYSGGGEPRSLSVAPTPSYSAARQGSTSLLTGWASPNRTRVKGPMGRWAHWWRDQSNILPLDLTIYF